MAQAPYSPRPDGMRPESRTEAQNVHGITSFVDLVFYFANLHSRTIHKLATDVCELIE